jgi:hypothetical protein
MKTILLALLLALAPAMVLGETVTIAGDKLRMTDSSGSPGGPTPPAPVVSVSPSDSVVTIQAKLNALRPGGSLVFAPGSYAFSGTLRGKNGVTLWADGVVTIAGPTAGAFDFSALSNWTVRGRRPGEGFVFRRTLLNATGASNFVVGNSIFQDIASNGLDGSAIRMSGASFGLVINNDFINTQGNVLGMYNWDNITVDGNNFTNVTQIASVHNNHNGDVNRGRNIKFLRNVGSGILRAAVEIGPGGRQSFTGIVVENNWFDQFGDTGENDGGSRLGISCVGMQASNTTIKNNFLRVGNLPASAGKKGVAIEIVGTGEVTGNTIVNFAYAVLTYRSGWNVHDNVVYSDGTFPYFGFVNNGKQQDFGTGTFGPATVIKAPTPAPAIPPKPTRIAW